MKKYYYYHFRLTLKSTISAIFTTVVLTRSSNHPEYKAHVLVLNSAHWQILIAVTHEPEPNSSKSYHPTFDFFTGPLSTVPPLLLTLTQLILIHATQTSVQRCRRCRCMQERSESTIQLYKSLQDYWQLFSESWCHQATHLTPSHPSHLLQLQPISLQDVPKRLC